ncbi:MAG: hypothetical protein UHX00_08240 [Caryophanon sp.]|nr:hypothetical protein [Caryophanon sp.]
MPKKSLTIVPVTLQPASDTPAPQNSSNVCTIKLANAEILLPNGVEERILRIILKELIP